MNTEELLKMVDKVTLSSNELSQISKIKQELSEKIKNAPRSQDVGMAEVDRLNSKANNEIDKIKRNAFARVNVVASLELEKAEALNKVPRREQDKYYAVEARYNQKIAKAKADIAFSKATPEQQKEMVKNQTLKDLTSKAELAESELHSTSRFNEEETAKAQAKLNKANNELYQFKVKYGLVEKKPTINYATLMAAVKEEVDLTVEKIERGQPLSNQTIFELEGNIAILGKAYNNYFSTLTSEQKSLKTENTKGIFSKIEKEVQSKIDQLENKSLIASKVKELASLETKRSVIQESINKMESELAPKKGFIARLIQRISNIINGISKESKAALESQLTTVNNNHSKVNQEIQNATKAAKSPVVTNLVALKAHVSKSLDSFGKKQIAKEMSHSISVSNNRNSQQTPNISQPKVALSK